jgi:hypothetical protein
LKGGVFAEEGQRLGFAVEADQKSGCDEGFLFFGGVWELIADECKKLAWAPLLGEGFVWEGGFC